MLIQAWLRELKAAPKTEGHIKAVVYRLYEKAMLWEIVECQRSGLDSNSAPIGVQQKLMRHAQVSTTMNVYGNALMTAKREANSKVVKMALRSA